MHEIRAIVSGKVQGVFFRDFVSKEAKRLALSGYAKNLESGEVEVVAQGERGPLEEIIELLNKGPFLAKVERVNVEWHEPAGERDGFQIEY